MPSLFTLRQSTAELLAASLVDLFPGILLVEGGATEQGFFYTFIAKQSIDQHALVLLEEKMRFLAKKDLPFRQIEMMRENAAQFLKHKGQRILAQEVLANPDNIVSLVQIGEFSAYCPIPLFPSTSAVEAFKLTKIEDSLQQIQGEGVVPVKKITGIAYPDKMTLKQHLKRQRASEDLDYRKLAKDMELFAHYEELSDRGMVWLPKGARLKQTLIDWWYAEHQKRHYCRVSTPTLVKQKLTDPEGR